MFWSQVVSATIFISTIAVSFADIKPIEIEKVSLRGDGCKKYEVAPVLSPQKTVLSVLFDNFAMTLPNEPGSPLGPKTFKNCDINLYIKSQKGVEITKLDIKYDLRGFLFLEPGLNATFTARALSVWRPSPRTGRLRRVYVRRGHLANESWGGGQRRDVDVFKDWTIESTTSISEPFQCTTDEAETWRIVIKNSAMMIANGRGIMDQSFGEFYLDTADFKSRVHFNIEHRSCE
jgi:hypothetical protein